MIEVYNIKAYKMHLLDYHAKEGQYTTVLMHKDNSYTLQFNQTNNSLTLTPSAHDETLQALMDHLTRNTDHFRQSLLSFVRSGYQRLHHSDVDESIDIIFHGFHLYILFNNGTKINFEMDIPFDAISASHFHMVLNFPGKNSLTTEREYHIGKTVEYLLTQSSNGGVADFNQFDNATIYTSVQKIIEFNGLLDVGMTFYHQEMMEILTNNRPETALTKEVDINF